MYKQWILYALWLKIGFDLYVSETLLYCARFSNALYLQFTLPINYIYYQFDKNQNKIDYSCFWKGNVYIKDIRQFES